MVVHGSRGGEIIRGHAAVVEGYVGDSCGFVALLEREYVVMGDDLRVGAGVA